MAKKPLILFSDAINYATFLCYYDTIQESGLSDAVQSTVALAVFLANYALTFGLVLHYCASEIALGDIQKIRVLVHERMVTSICWAALYAALATFFAPVQEQVETEGGYSVETTKWILVPVLGVLAAAVTVGTRITDCIFQCICCNCCLGRLTDTPEQLSDAKYNTGIMLQGILTSAMAWLLAGTWTEAIEATVVTKANATVVAYAKSTTGMEVGYMWVNFGCSILVAVAVVYFSKKITSALYLENAKGALDLGKSKSSGDRKKAQSIKESFIDLLDQTMIFVAVNAMKTAANATISNMYADDDKSQNDAVFVFSLLYTLAVSVFAVVLQTYLRSLVKSRNNDFELVFLNKMSTFLNRGFSGALGKLLHQGGNGLLYIQPAVFWPSADPSSRRFVYVFLVTVVAVVFAMIIGVIPGDLELIDIPKGMLKDKASDLQTSSLSKVKKGMKSVV
jgi:hypothetical protein